MSTAGLGNCRPPPNNQIVMYLKEEAVFDQCCITMMPNTTSGTQEKPLKRSQTKPQAPKYLLTGPEAFTFQKQILHGQELCYLMGLISNVNHY